MTYALLIDLWLFTTLCLGAPLLAGKALVEDQQKTITAVCPEISETGIEFFVGVDAKARWEKAVAQRELEQAGFATTHSNMLLANEVDTLSKSSLKAQDVNLALTFLALKTGLPISFSLNSQATANSGALEHMQVNQFGNSSLHIGGNDRNDHDDFGMTFSREVSEPPVTWQSTTFLMNDTSFHVFIIIRLGVYLSTFSHLGCSLWEISTLRVSRLKSLTSMACVSENSQKFQSQEKENSS